MFEDPPEAPSRRVTSPAAFVTVVNDFLAWLKGFAEWLKLNWPTISGAQAAANTASSAATAAVAAANWISTCATPVALTAGAKSITLQTGKAFPAAANLAGYLIRQSDKSVRLYGQLNPYTSGSGAATFTVSSVISGAGGPYSDWIFVPAFLLHDIATSAMIQAGTDPLSLLSVKALMDASVPQTLTDGATVTWDAAAGWNAKVTLGGNRTMAAITNARRGLTYVLEVIQDATGSRTLTWNSAYDFGLVGAPTLSTGAGKRDLVFLYCYDDTGGAPKFRATYSKSA